MTVLVTGADTPIGAAVVNRLAAAGHHHHLLLGGRDPEQLATLADTNTAGGGLVEYAAYDSTSAADTDAFIRAAFERSGHLDVLINNVGPVTGPRSGASGVAEWSQMTGAVRSVVNNVAAVLPIMREQGHGHIINVAPAQAPGSPIDLATQTAVAAITDDLRVENPALVVTLVRPAAVEFTRPVRNGGPQTATISHDPAVSAVAETIAAAVDRYSQLRGFRRATKQGP